MPTDLPPPARTRISPRHWDYFAGGVFLLVLVAYLVVAWFASKGAYLTAFDSISGYHIFDIDDSYRRYLAATPLSTTGVWFWNFYLPFNLLFDGLFSFLSGHSDFWMRVPHVIANLGGLWLVYRAGRHLQIHPGWLLLSCCTLLWMPLYALVSMSFYGESLLAAVMGVVIYALATERARLLAPFAAVMPFIRPEGAFYLGFLTLRKLWQRRFVLALAMMGPAFLYFVALMWIYDFSWGAYWQDRSAFGSTITAIGTQMQLPNEAWLPFYTINPLWWLLGLAGGLLPSMRRFWPLLLGVMVLVVQWADAMHGGRAHGEARYYFSLLPLWALYQSALLQAVTRAVRDHWRKWVQALVIILMLSIGAENVLQLDTLRIVLTQGQRYPVGKPTGDRMSILVYPPAFAQILKESYAFTCAYAQYDPTVTRVIVTPFQWFDKSAVCQLPPGVRVELAFQGARTTHHFLDGYFFTMFPAFPHYRFYRFTPAPNERIDDGHPHALYVTTQGDPLGDQSLTPLFTNQAFNIYKVRYQEFSHVPFFP